jgi:hypothetical protein
VSPGKPFDPEHYPWEKPAHLQAKPDAQPEEKTQPKTEQAAEQNQPAAGHKNPALPERSVVTAACGKSSVPKAATAGNGASQRRQVRHVGPTSEAASIDIPMSQHAAGPWLDFAHVKSQLPIRRVLEHLNLFAQLRGRGSQWRGPCPVHAQGQGRTFSVHLEENVFQCFHAKCAVKGDVIDLWAAVKGLKLRDAALELVTLFNLDLHP